jgi:hypothetical protein
LGINTDHLAHAPEGWIFFVVIPDIS